VKNSVIALRIHRIRLLAPVVLAVVTALSGGGLFDDWIIQP
jgi:hypothetical protein